MNEIKVPATVERVIDGDTIEVSLTFKFHVRVLNCWCAERNTNEGKEAAAFAQHILPAQSKTILTVPLLSKTSLPAMTFGRVVGSLTTEQNKDFSTTMVEAGYAKTTKMFGFSSPNEDMMILAHLKD